MPIRPTWRRLLGPLTAGMALRAGALELVWAETFGRVAPGEALLFEDSDGRLCLALNQASAAERLRRQRRRPHPHPSRVTATPRGEASHGGAA